MSFLDRIQTCQAWDPGLYRPFVIAGRQLGRVRHDFCSVLSRFPKVFGLSGDALILDEGLGDFASRTEAVHEVLLALREAGHLPVWRDEPYPVLRRWDEEPLMTMERGAVPHFGVRGFGVHMNGLVEGPEGLKIWVGKRSMSKPTGPGKLDQLVAGGQPHGIGVFENLVKECAEEAAIPTALAQMARPVSLLSYICERPEGLRDDVQFVYDLTLPDDFEPRNTDGEVDAFFLWSLEETMTRVAETDDFKFNCALVLIDLFLRIGAIGPNDPGYQTIAHGLRRPGED